MSSGPSWLARSARWAGNARWLFVVMTGLAGFVLIAYVVLKLAPDWFAETEGLDPEARSNARQGVRTAAFALLAGAIGVVGAVYTARTFALNRAGQLTDRFTKAIEQLGHKELDVRLGGIYALERIARDSEEDHPQVIEVLTAYVREHAPRRQETPEDDPPRRKTPKRESDETEPRSEQMRVAPLPRPPTDVQAVLSVLGRRNVANDRLVELDLSRTELAGANFQDGHFASANFFGANLRRATMVETDIRNASLISADLRGAHLLRTNLAGCRLLRAKLGGAMLEGADLSGATLGAGPFAADLSDARYNEHTTWPEEFNPDAAGARKSRELPRRRPA
jgi:hypothetical protein